MIFEMRMDRRLNGTSGLYEFCKLSPGNIYLVANDLSPNGQTGGR